LLRHGGNALVNKLRERQEVHFVDRSLQHAYTHSVIFSCQVSVAHCRSQL
jgi:hypothetical protein